MKRFITHILIFVILFGIFSPSLVDAQSFGGCSFSLVRGINWANCLTDILLWLLFGILSIIALVLMIAGMLLDTVMNITIVNMRTALNDFTGINIAWKILKDLMNIAFIFILVYEGIKLIIGQGSREGIKKFIFGVVMASILINFSLFFTKVLIDASNIITVGLYDSIIDRGSSVIVDPSDPTGRRILSITGLSVPIMDAVGLSTFYSTATFDSMRQAAGGNWNMLFIPIFGVFLFLIVSFVFLSISILLAVRFVTLLILLMLSPIAYMGLGLDFMKSYSSKWWNALNSQLIFPPVFMLMMLVTITLITSDGFLIQGNWGGILDANNPQAQMNFMNLLFKFTVVIGLTIASLTVSKGISVKGATQIATATSTLSGYAGGAIMGGTARFGRSTLGRYGNNVANDEDLKDRAAKGDIGARLKLSAANRLATSTFDGRSTETFGKLAKASGYGKDDFGKVDAKKQNFRAIQDQKAKDQEELLKRYKPSDLALKKAEEEFKEITKTDKFKAEEQKAKEDHLASDEYKNSGIYREAEKAKEEIQKIKDLESSGKKKLEELTALEKSNLQLEGEALKTRNEKIQSLKREIESEKNESENLKKNSEERDKLIKRQESYEKSWISDKQKELIARKGGQEEKKDKSGNITQVAVDSQYQIRANQVADKYAEGNWAQKQYYKVAPAITKYVSMVGGTATGMAAGAVMGSTLGPIGTISGAVAGGSAGYKAGVEYGENINKNRKDYRSEVARRIKKAAGGKKSVDDRLKEILKDEGEIKEPESNKEEKKDEKPAEPEAPKTT